MESNLHIFNPPINNISNITSTNISKTFNIDINNIHSSVPKSVTDNFELTISNINSFKNTIETLGEKSMYRWDDTFTWDDMNIWSDIERN